MVTEGNPLISSANTDKVRKAYAALEFYVYTGLFMEEAAYYADVILPVVSGLEFEGVYMRRDDRAIRWQQAALPAVGQSHTDPQIWIDLAQAMGRRDTKNAASYWTDAFPLACRDFGTLWDTFVANTPGMGGMTRQRMSERTRPLLVIDWKRPLHVVMIVDVVRGEERIVTVYEPDHERWSHDYRRRRR